MRHVPRYFAAAFVAACLAIAGFIAWGLPTQVRVAVPPLPSVTRTTHATTTTVDWKPAVRYATAVAHQRELIRAIKWASGLAHASQQQRLETNSHHVRTVPIPAARYTGRHCARGCIHASSPCAIPAYICARESGYIIDIYNPSGDASGKYQFLRSSWRGYGGYVNAADAPESVQDAYARLIWNGGSGCSNWSAC